MAFAITTKFLAPTNTKGSRIKATCSRESITVSFDHALNSYENHQAAVDALIAKLNDGVGGYQFKAVGPLAVMPNGFNMVQVVE